MFRKLFISISLFICVIGYSQEQDFRTWWAAEIRTEFFDLLDVKLSPELRFIDNSSRLSSYLVDLDLSIPFWEYFRVGGVYRFQSGQLKEIEYLENRFGAYLKADYKIKRFRIGYRGMYHWEYVGINTRENGSIPAEYHRHRLKVEYYKKKWDLRPEVGIEVFVNRKPEDAIYEQKIRYIAGLDYKINKKLSVSLSYKFQKEVFVKEPINSNILAAKISYRL